MTKAALFSPCNKLHNMVCVHAMNTDASPEIRYRIFKILDNNPHLTQRQMAGEMGISLGKFNYCLTELVKKGFVKMDRFRSSANKTAYMYLLTPRGLEEKARVTSRFLHRKMEEFTAIKKEIAKLTIEVRDQKT
jgi:EPS-associated MarR family transcriptional regulator